MASERSVIFLVHGMGQHGGKWANPWIEQLKNLYGRYEGTNLTRLDFDECFECIPITYDDVFADLLKKWRAKDASLAEAEADLKQAGHPELINLVEQALDEASGDDFWSTHATDVVLYRAVPMVREAVKLHVGKQIISNLNRLASQNAKVLPPWGIVSHSLGTIVSHDTLDAIWTLELNDPRVNAFAPDRPGAMAQMVMMVSNVSRLLQSKPKVLKGTTVMPAPKSGTEVPGHPGLLRGCYRYVNVWNQFDPFTKPGKFSPEPPDWPDSEAKGLFKDVRVDHIHEVNTHDFMHYMNHPAVHLELFTIMSGRSDAVAKPKWNIAIEQFEAQKNLPEQIVIDVKREVERLSVATDDLWPTISGLVKRFKKNVASLVE